MGLTSVFALLILFVVPNITESLNTNGTSETLDGAVALTKLTKLQRTVFILMCLGLLVIALCYAHLCDFCPKASDLDDEYRSNYFI